MNQAKIEDESKKFDATYDSVEKTKNAISYYTKEVEKLKRQTSRNAFSIITEIVTKRNRSTGMRR